MGRMKEVFMKMQEENFHGDPSEYLKQYAEDLKEQEYKEFMKDKDAFVCPNCAEAGVIPKDSNYGCTNCGYDFILIEPNTLRFK